MLRKFLMAGVPAFFELGSIPQLLSPPLLAVRYKLQVTSYKSRDAGGVRAG